MVDVKPKLLPPGTAFLMTDSSGNILNRVSRDWYKYFMDSTDVVVGTSNQIPQSLLSDNSDGEFSLDSVVAFSSQNNESANDEDQEPPFPLIFDASEPIDFEYISAHESGDLLDALENRIDVVESALSVAPKTIEDLTDKIFDDGTYTPTLTNVANLDASTVRKATWMRIGNTVSVSGQVDVDPTTTATATTLGISLPIPSTFTTAYQLGGTASAIAISGQSAGIQADALNFRASMTWKAVDVTNQTMTYTFQYEVV